LLPPIQDTSKVEAQKRERFPLERVNGTGLLAVHLHLQGRQVLARLLLDSGPHSSLAPVIIHQDDDVIGKAVVVQGVVGAILRLLVQLLKLPVEAIQIDIRGQRTERAS
jgi:hypothetical protein